MFGNLLTMVRSHRQRWTYVVEPHFYQAAPSVICLILLGRTGTPTRVMEAARVVSVDRGGDEREGESEGDSPVEENKSKDPFDNGHEGHRMYSSQIFVKRLVQALRCNTFGRGLVAPGSVLDWPTIQQRALRYGLLHCQEERGNTVDGAKDLTTAQVPIYSLVREEDVTLRKPSLGERALRMVLVPRRRRQRHREQMASEKTVQ